MEEMKEQEVENILSYDDLQAMTTGGIKFDKDKTYYVEVITEKYPQILEYGMRYKKLGYDIPNYCTDKDLKIITKEEFEEWEKSKKEEDEPIDGNEVYYVEYIRDWDGWEIGDRAKAVGTYYVELIINNAIKNITKEEFETPRPEESEVAPSATTVASDATVKEVLMEYPKLNYEQEKAIELEKEGKLPELAAQLKEDGRKKQTEETLKEILKEEMPRLDWIDLNDLEEETNTLQTTIFRQLASDFYEKQPYFYDSAKIWWMWNKEKSCWEKSDEVDIMNQFDRYFIQESEKSNIKSGIIEALKKCGRKNKPKEIKPSWVQFKKTIYDVENKDTFEATPEFFVSNPIPWEIGKSEETPLIDKLFKTWVKEKDVIKLYELIAYTCVPEMFIHSFIFLFSPPGMGKGTFVNLLLNFIGRYNAVSTSINRINSNPRFETKNWNKKLLITMSEVSNVNELKNSGLINQATGEDPIPAEEKGGGSYDFVNYGKFIYPTNKLLKIDPEDGFGRRARTIKFQTRFEREKNVLSDITNEEYENLAKKCLRIAKELYERRRFTGDVDISQRMSNYQEESKTILERFIDTECDISNFEEKVQIDEFFSVYSNYLKINGGKPKNKSELSKELKKLGWETKREWVPSTQEGLDGSLKKDYKTFILGIFLNTVNTVNTQSSLSSIEGTNRELGVNAVSTVHSKGNNDKLRIEFLDREDKNLTFEEFCKQRENIDILKKDVGGDKK